MPLFGCSNAGLNLVYLGGITMCWVCLQNLFNTHVASHLWGNPWGHCARVAVHL